MIKVENVETWGFDTAVRACRNPMSSWSKSDSGWGEYTNDIYSFDIGQNDLDLMKRLFKAGVEHRTYARLIQVSMDVTAPLYFWKEADRYSVGKSQISTSTMHKIHSKKFTLDDFSREHLNEDSIEALKCVIRMMNEYRRDYVDKDCKSKNDWWQLIQLLPSSYNQKRTIMMSYEVVFKMIKERTGHKLDEWCELVEILRDLPYVKEIMGNI